MQDWIKIIGVGAVAVGWFINSYLNRRNEIAKKRLEYRLPTLKSFLKIWYLIQESNETNPIDIKEYKKLIIEVREDFHLYGEKDEIELFEEFVKYVSGKYMDRDKSVKALEELVKLVRIKIRKELDIK